MPVVVANAIADALIVAGDFIGGEIGAAISWYSTGIVEASALAAPVYGADVFRRSVTRASLHCRPEE